MKEKIAGFLILILLVTAIFPSYVYCDDEDEEKETTEENQTIEFSEEGYRKIIDEGKAKRPGENVYSNIKLSFTELNFAGGVLGTIIVLPVLTIEALTAKLINGSFKKPVTVSELVYNRSEIIDADYIQNTSNEPNNKIKESVLKWYYALRVIAIALSLLMLIYIGIRMGVSSTATQEAKYKNMIIDWCISFAMIFILQYIIIIGLALSKSIVQLFADLNVWSIEENFDFFTLILNTKGWTSVAVIIMYLVFAYFRLKFIYIYFKRFFTIGFLIIVSPLITITYSLDRAKDGKSQILNTWFTEFIGNVAIQPVHAGIYTVFIITAGEIFRIAPFLSIILFAMLSRAEKIVKNTLGLKKTKTMKDMDQALALK